MDSLERLPQDAEEWVARSFSEQFDEEDVRALGLWLRSEDNRAGYLAAMLRMHRAARVLRLAMAGPRTAVEP